MSSTAQRHAGGRPRRAAGRDRGPRRRAGHLRRRSPRSAGCPSRRPPGCSPRSSAPSSSSAARPAAYVAGPLFDQYAARHDPWEELAHLARPVLEAISAETGETVNLGVPRGDRVLPRRPGRLPLPARHPRLDRWSTCRRTPPRSARCSTPTARSTCRAVRWPPSPSTPSTDPARFDERARARSAGAATPPPSTSSRSGSPASPRRCATARARWSPPSASPGPTARSRSGCSDRPAPHRPSPTSSPLSLGRGRRGMNDDTRRSSKVSTTRPWWATPPASSS